MKKGAFMAGLIFYILQWTWGITENIVGGTLYLLFKYVTKCRTQRFGYDFYVYVPGNFGGLSLGMFVFIRDTSREKNTKVWLYNTKIHEYGHSFQCMILGPFYWIIVAIPSFIWCNFFKKYRQKNKIPYFSFFCEAWANNLGIAATGLKMARENRY